MKRDSRQGHAVTQIQAHFDDRGALDVHLFAGCGVPPCDPAGLIESMGLHPARVITHKYL